MPHLHSINIRKFLHTDILLGQILVEETGWNQTFLDWERAFELNPEGCFVAELNAESVGTTMCSQFGEVGWIAMVLVKSAYRGMGIGEQLVQNAITYLECSGVSCIRLDATQLGQRLYEKLGFISEYEVIRFVKTGPAIFEQQPTSVLNKTSNIAPLDALLNLDYKATATERASYYKTLNKNSIEYLFEKNGELSGFATYRVGRNAFQLGPVIATNNSAGRKLLNSVIQRFDDKMYYIDIPVSNKEAIAWAEETGLAVQRKFMRMYRGKPIMDNPQMIWASSGPEKG